MKFNLKHFLFATTIIAQTAPVAFAAVEQYDETNSGHDFSNFENARRYLNKLGPDELPNLAHQAEAGDTNAQNKVLGVTKAYHLLVTNPGWDATRISPFSKRVGFIKKDIGAFPYLSNLLQQHVRPTRASRNEDPDGFFNSDHASSFEKARRQLNQLGKGTLINLAAAAEQGDNDSLDQVKTFLRAYASIVYNKTFDPERTSRFNNQVGFVRDDIHNTPYLDDLYTKVFNEVHSHHTSYFETDTPTNTQQTFVAGQAFSTRNANDLNEITQQNRAIAKARRFTVNRQEFKTHTRRAITETAFYDLTNHTTDITSRPHTTKVSVVNADAFATSMDMLDRGLNPLVMDAANGLVPGGGARNGHGHTQEESMCYSSPDLLTVLEAAQQKARIQGTMDEGYFIPVRGGVYLPHITVARNKAEIGADEGYDFMEQPYEVSVYATAAFRHKDRLNQNRFQTRRQRGEKVIDEQVWPEISDPQVYADWTYKKILSCFDAGYREGHDSLVLAALGNGAFANPVEETLNQFERALQEYDGVFKEVRFAVLTPSQNTSIYDQYDEKFSS